MVEDGGRGKGGDARQRIILHKFGGVQAAAGEDSVLDAGGEHILVGYLQIHVLLVPQAAITHIIGQLVQVVPIRALYGASGQFHDLIANIPILDGTILALQRFQDGGMVRFLYLPQIGRFGSLHWASIRHVKDIFQAGSASAVLADEGNALSARFHPAPHPLIPQLHTGAGGGIRALGVDEELFVKRIFIETGGRLQIPHPAVSIPRNGSGSLACQIGYFLQFICHSFLLFIKINEPKGTVLIPLTSTPAKIDSVVIVRLLPWESPI